jgi:hypothetical protein
MMSSTSPTAVLSAGKKNCTTDNDVMTSIGINFENSNLHYQKALAS